MVRGGPPRSRCCGRCVPPNPRSTPEQVASLVAYLASPLAASMTGHDYLVDGGAGRNGWPVPGSRRS
ncbi:SDR family oxidoreductase [Amycolatopsis minnesotensis]|uniref:SDR family oxidoreductase n=1 Tax=Amycolatopsis minnesotensis TaxID=337894 RepID=UPI003CD0BA09